MRYIDVVMADRPSLVMMLDEPSGTVAHAIRASGGTTHGTYAASGVTYRRPGPSTQIPWGIEVDGVAGYVQLPTLQNPQDLSTNTPRTWEVWVRRTSSTTNGTAAVHVIGSNVANTHPMRWGNVDAFLTNEIVSISNNGQGADDRTGWDFDRIISVWNHHVLTYNGNQNGWTYYLNGAARGTKMSNSGGCFGFQASDTYYLGRAASSFSNLWFAAFALYPYEMSAAQVAGHSQAGRGGVRPHPTKVFY